MSDSEHDLDELESEEENKCQGRKARKTAKSNYEYDQAESESENESPERKSRKSNKSDSEYEPDQSELQSYGRRARKQAKFDSSMFFDSEASSDDDWYNPKRRGGRGRGPPRERVPIVPVYSSDSDTLGVEESESQNDVEESLPPNLDMMYSAWHQFISFSQFTATKAELEKEKLEPQFKSSWSPYKADMKKCQLYLKVLREKCKFGVRKVDVHYNALCRYLNIGLEKKTTDQLISACKTDMKKLPKRLVRRMDTYKHSPSQKLWNEFSLFCNKTERSDPYLSQPSQVRDFLVMLFVSKDKFKIEDDRMLRPFIDFYTENVDMICKQLNFYLEYSYKEGNMLISSNEVELLREVGEALDHREVLDSQLGAELIPAYWFVKYITVEHSKPFWRHGLVRRMMDDISTGHLTVMQVAWQLGVSPDMVSSVMGKNKTDTELNFTVEQYIKLGFGTKEQYWQENSTVNLLEEVRERVSSLDHAAFLLGVSARELQEKVGEIKTEEQVKREKEELKVQQQPTIKEKVKKLSALELQIKEMEKNEDSLSEYEQMRLKNMRERQEMVEMLNFNEDKEELEMLAPKRIVKPKDYGVREKSSRIKRKVEEEVDKSDIGVGNGKGGKRQSPSWVGIWTPRTTERVPYTCLEVSAMIPVPRVQVELGEMLEISQDYHKASRILQRIQAEVREGEGKVEKGKICWGEVQKVRESRVSQVEVMSVSCWDDMVCTGDMAGGVAVTIAGRTLGLKPHHLCVCRTVFLGEEGLGGLSVLSGSHDGTVRCTDLQEEKVSMESSWERREVRWLEVETSDTWLVNLGGKEVVRVDRRDGGQGTQLFALGMLNELKPDNNMSVLDHPKVGTNLSLCPSNQNLLSVVSGLDVLVYDLRSAGHPLHRLSHLGGSVSGGWSGAGWSPEGGYLLGSQLSGTVKLHKSECVVWETSKLGSPDTPVLNWPATQTPHTGSSSSYYYGASWSPWQEGVFLTTARVNTNMKVASYHSVVAVDVTTNSVISELTQDLSYSTYCIASHPTRHQMVVANSTMPGMVATYQYLST